MFDVNKIKKDFPIFKNNPNLVYLDSAATSLKPKIVIDKLVEYYENYSANIKRGIYKISEKATEEYEETRKIIADFINADSEEIIFTRGTTESINLVAYGLGRKIVDRGDEIVVSVMEHHSNFVPWQQLAFEMGADFKVIDIDEEGRLQVQSSKFKVQNDNSKFKINLNQIITKKTKILALNYVSNVLGTINPIKEIIQEARRLNPTIIVVIDAAQAVPHMKVDVKELGCDFLAFSGHKMLGPTGAGVLFGKRKLLEEMFPFQYGGEMIEQVRIEKTSFAQVPEKFEAGTPSIADVIAFKEAIDYLKKIGMENVRNHEIEITKYALELFKSEFGDKIKIYGPKKVSDRGGVIAFTLSGVHPHDLATVLDEENVAVRAGHHCAMPLHTRLNIPASTRASFYIYTSKEDIDNFIQVLKKASKLFNT